MTARICSYTFEEYCEKVKTFHGGVAPGVVIGGFMVDMARRNLPSDTLFDAICETKQCLPDAIQLLTPCKAGNQWLKVIDVGRYALVLYDKQTGEGVRVHIDLEKLQDWPAIREWFLKLKPKAEQDEKQLLDQILEAGGSILRMEKVNISPEFLARKPGKTVAICPLCNEPYRAADGLVCPGCAQDKLPYVREPAATELDEVGT